MTNSIAQRLRAYFGKDELRPCPFCDSSAEHEIEPESYGYSPEKHSITCPGCGIETVGFDGQYKDVYKNKKGKKIERYEYDEGKAKKDAFNAWNTRTADPLIQELLGVIADMDEGLSGAINYTQTSGAESKDWLGNAAQTLTTHEEIIALARGERK